MAAVALLTGTWAAIFLQGHRSQSEPETGPWTCNFLSAQVPRCHSQFTGHLRDFQEKCWPHVLASEPKAWVRLRLLGAVSATAHTYRQLASTSEDTSQTKENVDCKWRPHIVQLDLERGLYTPWLKIQILSWVSTLTSATHPWETVHGPVC